MTSHRLTCFSFDSEEEECDVSCHHETVCEDKGSVQIDCGDGIIDIISANYGRTKTAKKICKYGKCVS